MIRPTLHRAADFDAIAADWQALEARAPASFFQSWTWTGCLAAGRFADALLLRAEHGGRLAGLALLGRTGAPWLNQRLHLGESGDPARDTIYIEHNGPLLAADAQHLLLACLDALLARGRILRLSGVGDAVLAAARAAGAVRILNSQPAPFIDLSALGDGEGAYLARLSANTRYQLRRSDRSYAGSGPIAVRRAGSLPEALEFLDALGALHQATWTARGKPGAFANPAFVRFHRALLARAIPRNEADLLRISAGERLIGYLYNFRYRGQALVYQSGFDYAAAAPHEKPGLTCHHAAIAQARRDGLTRYDFLAGGDRYKSSLATDAVTLHWLEVARPWSLAGMALRGRALLRK